MSRPGIRLGGTLVFPACDSEEHRQSQPYFSLTTTPFHRVCRTGYKVLLPLQKSRATLGCRGFSHFERVH